jgi:hypothetical protein
MKKFLTIACAISVLSFAYAAEQAHSPAPYHSLKGDYAIYSGDLGEQQAPTRSDRKVSFIIEGQGAKDVFNAMPPDEKDVCSSEKGARSRRKEHVWCTFSPKEGYTCYMGFDLRTGKSIGGGIC